MRQRISIVIGLLLATLPHCTTSVAQSTSSPAHTFRNVGDHFELDGKPFEVLSGELHYARIPHEYWRARIRMARAMGLNTIATYVFWNVHEPKPGQFVFSGDADLSEFLRIAQQEHMWVLLRAGPYACAEWEFGGFPAWLLQNPEMATALRSNSPAFMVPAERWIMRLGQEVAQYQIENNGPVIATQVENEYGNFSNDHTYMQHMRDIFVKAGFTRSMLYTVDPSKAIANGNIPGVVSGVNFGTGRAKDALNLLARSRPDGPLFASEYWPGWFDLWGFPHETRPIDPQLGDLTYMLDHHASVNIYMLNGGTNFGFMAGASQSTGNYRGNVTSYDYDAPLSEAGHPTKKFFEYRDLILQHTGKPRLPLPTNAPVATVAPFTLQPMASLWDNLPPPVHADRPQTMEQLGQAYGYILYRTHTGAPLHDALLTLDHPYDYAQVYLDGKLAGTLDRHYRQTTLRLTSAAPAQLDILIENTGRLNSTKFMRDERKGMRGAELDGKPLLGWDMYSLNMDTAPVFSTASDSTDSALGPHIGQGSFILKKVGDMYLDVRQLGKGLVWINGHALGRVWNIGPQDTLYVPAPWLRVGKNRVVVFDLFATTHRQQLAGLAAPILDGPTPTYTTDPERNKVKRQDGEFGSKLTEPADTPIRKNPQ